ncbi:hypothetical protein RHSIM_Rhsim06G0233500 [Rhododendron simsii]|uniref:25S rRNA (uridine-N(3))-methyltransferase BMT5-like domain-containing protein n=1 Tax=Rhododendron simsii TaxID=118357 RepID=A0A834LLX0_RHOSS|nr:hypothetical protein RHSIM_Rhsim06G0233500 [Rhododendron simsii]
MGSKPSIVNQIKCGEAEDESDQNPRETSSHFLIYPSIPPFKTITRTELRQTNSSEHSSIDPSITTPVSNPPPDHLSDLVCGDSTSNTVALHQNLLISPPQSSVLGNSQRDSRTAHAIQQDTAAGEKVIINKAVVVIEERWIKHYSNFQKILLVGEGDFSFSASLAVAFGFAHNIIATSLNTTETSVGHLDYSGYLSRNYGSAMSNIQSLRSRGAKVMHDVDATQMAGQILFQGLTFDRIVFNFPLSGFFPDDSRESNLRRERKLIRLFIANAIEMIAEGGEIHVTHKSNGFFREWNLEQLASSAGLQLIDEVHFNFTDFPGYCTKYGFGGDKNFNCNPSKTYKFGF